MRVTSDALPMPPGLARGPVDATKVYLGCTATGREVRHCGELQMYCTKTPQVKEGVASSRGTKVAGTDGIGQGPTAAEGKARRVMSTHYH